MQIIHSEILILISSTIISWLIAYNGDRDFLILLKGKLFKQGRDTNIAIPVYKKHKRHLSLIFFMIGGAGSGLSVMMLVNKNPAFPFLCAATVGFLCLGIWGRIKSFRLADRELDELDNKPQSN